MYKIKITKKKDFMPNLVSRMKKLSGQKVQVGWFKELGQHKSGSIYEVRDALSYTQLAAILDWGNRHTGMKGFHFTDAMMNKNRFKGNKVIKNILHSYLSDIHKNSPKVKAKVVMETIAGEYVENYRNIIGDKTSLRALEPSTISYKSIIGSKTPDAPLLAFGDFKKKVSYKLNGVVVTP